MPHPRAKEIVVPPDPVFPEVIRGMTWVESNRNYELRTTLGHVILFRKGVKKLCPNVILEDAMAVGIIPVDDADLPHDDYDGVLPAQASGTQRIAQIREIIAALKARNARGDFTASGMPSIIAVNDALGYKIDITELGKIWQQLRSEEADDRLDPAKALDNAPPVRPSDEREFECAMDEALATVMGTGSPDHFTAAGAPTVRAIENLLRYEITEDERDVAFGRARDAAKPQAQLEKVDTPKPPKVAKKTKAKAA